MAFTFGSTTDDRFERLERRVAMLETIILEQRNKRVWSVTEKEEPVKAPRTQPDDSVRCRGGCLCSVEDTPVAYHCDVCNRNNDGRRWRCERHDWDGCPRCVGVPAPEGGWRYQPRTWDPPREPVNTARAMAASPHSLFAASSPASLGTLETLLPGLAAELAAKDPRWREANQISAA
jgi:hypothetical protein